MKVLYSQLKKYLPDLKADAKAVADSYTMIGSMIDKFLNVKYEGKDDVMLDLEVRQNRADNFSVQGLARELSAFYDIPLSLPQPKKILSESNYELPIEIKALSQVKRLMAVKIKDIKISESPKWLQEYLALYEINSINNLVDLTNYVMLETGFPSHVFDADLVGDKLIWEINEDKYKTIETLNGDELEITKDALVISDGKRPLSLSFIGGGIDAVSSTTKTVVLEMGVYNGGMVRRNERQMKVLTEAGLRLEKYLDSENVDYAFNWLLNLILDETKSSLDSKIYDNYLQKVESKVITLRYKKVSDLAGIEISKEKSLEYLKRLGFEILEDENEEVKVKRPVNRMDISLEEDVIEEIIRLEGFYNIPVTDLKLTALKDITPTHLKLIDRLKPFLASIGFDEVRSWVLVDEIANINANYLAWNPINVTNSINEEVSTLRQSLSVNLLDKFMHAKQNFLSDIMLFEEGKTFGKLESSYVEFYQLGMLIEGANLSTLQLKLETMLRSFGMSEIIYRKSNNIPQIAHPKTSYDILVKSDNAFKNIGIIFVTNNKFVEEVATIAEVNIDILNNLINTMSSTNATMEITQKIVTLDANVISEDTKIDEVVISKLSTHRSNLWSWEIKDKYENNNKMKYTIRVSYLNLDDKTAKQLHEEIFG